MVAPSHSLCFLTPDIPLQMMMIGIGRLKRDLKVKTLIFQLVNLFFPLINELTNSQWLFFHTKCLPFSFNIPINISPRSGQMKVNACVLSSHHSTIHTTSPLVILFYTSPRSSQVEVNVRLGRVLPPHHSLLRCNLVSPQFALVCHRKAGWCQHWKSFLKYFLWF